MNRDKKLGLALGVLLVGIVAAFFFRNDRAADPVAPKLERPQALDDRIAERPFSPYLPPESDGSVRNASHGAESRRNDRDDDADDPGTMRPVPFGQESHGATAAPDPIPFFSDDTDRSRGRTPDHNRDWTPLPDDRSQRSTAPSRTHANAKPAADARVSDMKVHEVRPGETLSGIAAKHLGSSTKFHEIYQANRDQLKSPNDLRAGMKLKIPRRVENTASGRDAGRTRPADSRDRRAETETPDRSSAALRDPDFSRTSADRDSRSSAPTRNISSRPFNDEQPFPADSEPPPRRAEPATDDEESAGHLFRPARKNPLPSGTNESFRSNSSEGKPAPKSRSLSQRLPEDFPELDETDPRRNALRSEPATKRPADSSAFGEKPLADTKPFGDAKPSDEAPRGAAKGSSGTSGSTTELAPGRYLVRRGDTLEKIAQRLLGDRNAAPRILDANRDLLRSTDDLREGMSLAIPR